ncbi:putative Ig domain-containing protein [Spirosoma sp. KUDC1026]|uniref:putative Ig domain-containing protein n=1 Tax=Spirosoma sp. KUDC1026 TaxID=2745947 RepID=UPI00159BB4AC|nr:putative Ig domain-containing protein [Spirosoma sp. KUDC1026]QKZ14870.1 T9SS type A sorting domain-containing protein [Spirosoma sp. KUDC1026]
MSFSSIHNLRTIALLTLTLTGLSLAGHAQTFSGKVYLADQTSRRGSDFVYQLPASALARVARDASGNPVLGLPAGLSFNAKTRRISGTPTQPGTYPITIKAIDPTEQTTFTITVLPAVTKPLVLEAPQCDCATGAITFRTTEGDGTPITFSAIGVKRTAPTDVAGTIETSRLNTPEPLLIKAMQSGKTTQFTFDLPGYCGLLSAKVENTLRVQVLGNPTLNEQVEVEVSGVQGKSVHMRLLDSQGKSLSEQSLDVTETSGRQRVNLGRTPGTYLLQVTDAAQFKTVKIVKQ